ncbi:MAG: phospho-N-acetylmuramoyl-pentapeptide-transferase [Akkermansia sp.]
MESFIQLILPDTGSLSIIDQVWTRAILACAVAFFATLLTGPRVIRALISLKLGQPIRSAQEVHKLAELHGAKAGTPTMGGVLILVGTLLTTLVFAQCNRLVLVSLGVMLVLGVLGFSDDYLKIKMHNSDGIRPRVKLIVQTLTGIVAMCLLYFIPESGARIAVPEFISQVFVPFYGIVDLGCLCIPFGMLVVLSASNAVNLTDGLDGLASGCTVSTGVSFALIACLVGCPMLATETLQIPHHPMAMELSVFAMSLVGSCLGFLWYNCFPAKVFMGDTGSLAIGGALGMIAICTAQELLFVVIGGVFVMEALSVVLQVASFKTTGKRIFAMSPIHHHFELKGWKETQVIVRFWMISLILALFGLFLLITH